MARMLSKHASLNYHALRYEAKPVFRLEDIARLDRERAMARKEAEN